MLSDPILSAFDRRLRRFPEAPLVVSRRRQASPADIDRMARPVGSHLAEHSVTPGTIVALAAANGPGFLAALLAVRRAGAVALLFDARAPETEKRRIAAVLGAATALDCRRGWPLGPGDFNVTRLGGDRTKLPADVAAIKLTSGSTGQPRGIVTPSAALVADDEALAETMGLAGDERILAAIPMSHSYGLSSVVMPALMRRSVLVLPDETNPLDPMIVAREREITFLPTVPAYLQALLRRSRPATLPPTLRLVVSAGAPLKPATAVRFRQVYGRPVHVFYGASECGGISFDRTGTAGERGSLGTAVEGVEITLEPLPRSGPESEDAGPRQPGYRQAGPRQAGPHGSVTVASAAVARGYVPETDQARRNTSLGGGRFRTRDLGVLRDGELFLEGRLDDLINVRGKKVNPREVEAVLAQLDGVDEAVTLGILPPGQDEIIVRSFVACRPGSLSYETVQAWCRRHLAEHKVPRSIVLLEVIPRTARGKLDRAALLGLRP